GARGYRSDVVRNCSPSRQESVARTVGYAPVANQDARPPCDRQSVGAAVRLSGVADTPHLLGRQTSSTADRGRPVTLRTRELDCLIPGLPGRLVGALGLVELVGQSRDLRKVVHR